jgi:3'-phosphoadenosine 5'-phosphosulfate sulfotransferase (PAPS reductase)/FAD synthetase
VGDVRFRSDGHINKDGAARGVDLIASGSIVHTRMMKTEALKQAVGVRGLNVAFDGVRRGDEEARKERILSFRSRGRSGRDSVQLRKPSHKYEMVSLFLFRRARSASRPFKIPRARPMEAAGSQATTQPSFVRHVPW